MEKELITRTQPQRIYLDCEMHTSRSWKYAVTIVAILMIALGLLQLQQTREEPIVSLLWRTEFLRIDKLLQTIETRPPQDISPLLWKTGVDRVRAGFWNACFSEACVSTTQLSDLRHQLEPIVRNDVDSFESLVRIWDTIGGASASASEHIMKFREDFLQYLPKRRESL